MCRNNCIVCKQKAFLHCEPSCGFSDVMLWCLSSRTGCSCGASFHQAEAIAFEDLCPSQWRDCNECTRRICLQSGFPRLVLGLALLQSPNRVAG